MKETLFDSSFAPPLPATSDVPASGTPSPPPPPSPVLCPSDAPLVLLPVRLETRFFDRPAGGTELRVRIYPDKIHLDSHEPGLTTDERTWGRQYVEADWAAGNDTAARSDAWRTLAGRFGAARAAWIARVLRPVNLAQRPTAPVAAGQAAPVRPVFPDLPPVEPGGEDAWRHAPQARLMPDRWTAVVHAGGKVAVTVTAEQAIASPLNVGPAPDAPALSPQEEAAVLAGEKLAIDKGMEWMVDFEAAERAGMALRIPVPSGPLDSLVVFGVRGTADAAATGSALADLLDAHHYTDGLAFLRFGTPTNNSDDARSGYDSSDPGQLESFGREVLADPQAAPNAARTGAALGLPAGRIAETLGRLARATQDHGADQRSMNTALWPVSWGYFLGNMLGSEAGLDPSAVDWARAHFLSNVRCGGPLPLLRAGRQPYGILPVSSLQGWTPSAGDPDAARLLWLKDKLARLRDAVWRAALPQVARIGRRQAPHGPDPDADLADVMLVDGVSHGQVARSVVGRHAVEHLYALNALPFGQIAATLQDPARKLPGLLGLPDTLDPRLARVFMAAQGWPVRAPLVQPGTVSPWDALQPDFIGDLLAQRSIDALIAMRPDPLASNPGTPLLQALLRHALLRELAQAAARIVATLPAQDFPPTLAKPDLAALLRDAELVDLVDVPPVDFTIQPTPRTLHWRRQLAMKVPAITGTRTVRAFLAEVDSFAQPELVSLGDFRAALAHLRNLDSELLGLLMQGTLDLAAHRLDAWITSYATRRLETMTAGGSAGARVGAYGWVENLQRAAPATEVPASARPPQEAAPLYAPAQDSGFIHAPSLTHATAAAVLRNAHLGPSGVPKADGPFAIDLSSARVREATRLLDGVRQGQPLGALLGYRLERRLHELQLDRFIAPLRGVAPLAVRARDGDGDAHPVESIAANNVVDGLVLLNRWGAGGDTARDEVLRGASPGDGPRIDAEVEALRGTLDALGDALTAEAAYQMARGNTSRMASTLSAIAQGEAPPPELEVARIPRTGTSLTHRLAVLMSGAPQPGPGWAAWNSSVLSNSERMLNAWATRLLGDPRKARCTVERVDAGSGKVVQTLAFALSELPLTALDFLYGLDAAGESQPGPCHIEQWVLYQAQRRSGGFGAVEAATLRLQHARPADLAAGEATLFDLVEQGRALRHLLEQARGLRPDDLAPPGRAALGQIDLADLEARVLRGENGLNAMHKQLQTRVAKAAATPPTATAEDLRAGMLALGLYGVGAAVPSVAVGDSPEILALLARQAAALLKASGPRVDQTLALRALPAATEARARCEQLLERGRVAFGPHFVMLPGFSCEAGEAAELKRALAGSTAQQDGDALAAHGWFMRSTRVREAAARLGGCLRTSEVLAAGERLSLSVAQLPFDAAERWVGLPLLPGGEMPHGKLSMVVQSSQALDPALPLAGLLVDEWVEVVPNREETTALTFQFDAPNAMAPQNLLVAVPPVAGQPWTAEGLRQVLMETLDLAKLRAVDGSLLGAAAQYLPATYLPFNPADDVVSTDFRALTT